MRFTPHSPGVSAGSGLHQHHQLIPQEEVFLLLQLTILMHPDSPCLDTLNRCLGFSCRSILSSLRVILYVHATLCVFPQVAGGCFYLWGRSRMGIRLEKGCLPPTVWYMYVYTYVYFCVLFLRPWQWVHGLWRHCRGGRFIMCFLPSDILSVVCALFSCTHMYTCRHVRTRTQTYKTWCLL